MHSIEHAYVCVQWTIWTNWIEFNGSVASRSSINVTIGSTTFICLWISLVILERDEKLCNFEHFLSIIKENIFTKNLINPLKSMASWPRNLIFVFLSKIVIPKTVFNSLIINNRSFLRHHLHLWSFTYYIFMRMYEHHTDICLTMIEYAWYVSIKHEAMMTNTKKKKNRHSIFYSSRCMMKLNLKVNERIARCLWGTK